MGAGKTAFADLRHIQISQSRLSLLATQENIGTFDVSVEDIEAVEFPESKQQLDGDSPNFLLFNALFVLLV